MSGPPKTLNQKYSHLWPISRRDILTNMFKDIQVLSLPSEENLAKKVPSKKTILVVEGDTKLNPMSFLQMGFDHILYQDRNDFPSEILASSFMILRPTAFSNNPIPFFFSDFSPTNDNPKMDMSFSRSFYQSEEKPFILQELSRFLSQSRELTGVRDLVVQTADELISNALYNAPVDRQGEPLFRNRDRRIPVVLPDPLRVQIFSCFSEKKVIIGCQDPFGSIQRNQVLPNLVDIFSRDTATPNMGSAGAGLGFKFIVDNAANFYIYCEPRRQTLVASGFHLSGMKANLAQTKNFHISL